MTDHATNNDTETGESLIRFVETATAQQRSPEGDLRGYVIDVEDWRQMRAAIRRLAARDADVAAQAKAEALAPVIALADEVTRWADGVANETSAKVGRWVVRRIRAAVAVPEPEEEQ